MLSTNYLIMKSREKETHLPLKDMLSARLGRKIMGGNEHDYRMTAEVWQEGGQ